jgi:hypothetical protein
VPLVQCSPHPTHKNRTEAEEVPQTAASRKPTFVVIWEWRKLMNCSTGLHKIETLKRDNSMQIINQIQDEIIHPKNWDDLGLNIFRLVDDEWIFCWINSKGWWDSTLLVQLKQ